MCLPVKATVAILLLFSGFFGAFAQETIAVHPLGGESATPMSNIFFEELIKAIPAVPGYSGVYRSFIIDLVNNRPADVPPGGFPPYVCPSPSLTARAVYAITGEVGESKDYPGDYWLRIYLWQMDKGRLVASDMVNASDRESCAATIPYVLIYLYSVIDETKLAVQPQSAQQQAEQALSVYRPTSKPRPVQRWLNLGLHGGVGNSTWFDGETSSSFMNASAAFQVGINVFPLLTVQTEVNLNGHYAIDDFDTSFWYMTIPLLLKLNMNNEPYKASIYAGPYFSIPMSFSESPYKDADFYDADFLKLLGLSYGVSVGLRLGPGFFFIDARFSHLLFFSDDDLKYPSNAAVFGIGYDIDFIIKKKVRQ